MAHQQALWQKKEVKTPCHNVKGFTLIELMIAVAIVGILSAIALPYYGSYVQEGKNASALTAITVLASRLESNFLDNRHYGVPGNKAGSTCSVATVNIEDYTITCGTVTNSEGYNLTATSTDGKYSYRFHDNGNRGTTKFANQSITQADNGCWLKTATICY